MKKISLFLMAAIAMVAGFTSCQKEELAKGTFTATMERFASKDGKMLLDGRNYSWEAGSDVIVVSRKNASNAFFRKGTYQATSVNSSNEATFTYCNVADEADVTDGSLSTGTYYAHFPSTILHTKTNSNHQVVLPSNQYTDALGRTRNVPMYAESPATSRNLQFKNLCGIVRLNLTKSDVSVSRIVITTPDDRITGMFNVSWPADIPLSGYQAGEESNHSVVLTCNPSQSIANGHNFDIALPAGTYTNMEIKIYNDDNDVCTKNLYGSLQINRAQYTVIELNGNSANHELDFETTSALIDGELPGVFSVSPTRQVRFSRGNLQYKSCNSQAGDLTHDVAYDVDDHQYSLGMWQFAEHQWDRMFSTGATADNTSSSTVWIDLLRWGTSGYMNHYPYYLGTLPATIEGNNSDWGVFNAISNGGNEPGLWRTLTKDEFEYLLNSRGDNKRVRACVHGVNGIILQPDEWIGSTPSVSITWNSSTTWSAVSDDDWQILENAGAVFLPVTGRLSNSDNSVTQVIWGNYWTATNSSSTNAYYIQFKSNSLTTANQDKKYGCAVRLVRNVD